MSSTKNETKIRLIPLSLCLALFYLQVMSAAPLPNGTDEQTCIVKLEEAEESYYNGDLERSILLAKQCLEDPSLSEATRIRAHKIAARAYLKQGQNEEAQKSVLILLDLNPAYQPTIEEESPPFVQLVAEARAEYIRLKAEQEKTGINPWIWIGAGSAAAAAIIVLVAGSSGSEDNPSTGNALPAPPALP